MWFVFLGAGLTLLVASGLYLRHRVGDALAVLGAGPRAIRASRALTAWLLFGYPLVMFGSVVLSLATGRSTMPRYDGTLGTWLLVDPFFLAGLVLLQALPYLGLFELVHVWLRRRRGPTVAGRFRARAVLLVLAGFALYTPLRILAEHGALRVRHHRVGPGAARAGGPSLRIVFLSDLQRDGHTDGARAAQVVAAANASHPDLVLAGGDWIDMGPDYIGAAADAAGALTSRLGTFSVRGDHEHFAYLDRTRSVRAVEDALAARGVAMLHDEVRWFEDHGRRLGVVFLEHDYLARADGATVDALVAEVAGADYAILLTHQLDAALAARVQGKVDLVLAGHTHGGQVNPVLGLVHVPLARLETPYVDGRYQLGPTTIIVTAGIGFSLVPFRYASPASLEVIDVAW